MKQQTNNLVTTYSTFFEYNVLIQTGLVSEYIKLSVIWRYCPKPLGWVIYDTQLTGHLI